MKKLFLLLALPSLLGATSPVINRYLPSHTALEVAHFYADKPAVSVGFTAAHAAKTFARNEDEMSLHSFDGLMEINGFYNLQNLIAAKKEADPSYISPFVRETGGDAWAAQQLPFGAISSLSAYGVQLGVQLPVAKDWCVGFNVPFWHLEARQQYRYPITRNSQTISPPDAEQVRRFRRYVHKDFNLDSGDWVSQTIGDVSGWAQWSRTWEHCWLLRSATLAGRLALSLPTAAYSNINAPHSVPAGGDGHWGVAASFLPATQLKEGIRLGLPISLVWQPPDTHERRCPMYSEPAPFSPLIAQVKVTPGLTFRIAPVLTMEHLVENVHFSFGFVWTRHFTDTWKDVRTDRAVPSYLSRTAVPTATPEMTFVYDQAGQITNLANQQDKKARSGWRSSYLSFDVQYEMDGIAKSLKYAPILRFTFDYCLSGSPTVARTHQITGQLSWRF